MLIQNFRNKKIKPLRDLVAFRFIEQTKTRAGFYLPETYHDFNLRAGRLLVGQILAVAPKIKSLKPDDFFLFHEYSLKNFEGTPNNMFVYFIEEKLCKAKLLIKDSKILEILNIPMSSKKEKGLLEEADRGIN